MKTKIILIIILCTPITIYMFITGNLQRILFPFHNDSSIEVLQLRELFNE